MKNAVETLKTAGLSAYWQGSAEARYLVVRKEETTILKLAHELSQAFPTLNDSVMEAETKESTNRYTGKKTAVLHLKDVVKSEPLSEERFWEIVESVDWASRPNCNRAKAKLMQRLTSEERECLSWRMGQAKAKLSNVVDERWKGLGDDSFGDALCEVIGRGRDVYENFLDSPSEYGWKEGLKVWGEHGVRYFPVHESFGYCLPSDYDKDEELTWEYHLNQLTECVGELDKPSEAADLVAAFRAKDSEAVEAWAAQYGMTAELARNRGKGYHEAYSSLPRADGWGVPNVVTDALTLSDMWT